MKKIIALACICLSTSVFANKVQDSFSVINYSGFDGTVVGEYCEDDNPASCDSMKPIGDHFLYNGAEGFLLVPEYGGSHDFLLTQITDDNGKVYQLQNCLSVNRATLTIFPNTKTGYYHCDPS
jgi:hypothetical protein